jgi:hypothetical protein
LKEATDEGEDSIKSVELFIGCFFRSNSTTSTGYELPQPVLFLEIFVNYLIVFVDPIETFITQAHC